MSQSHPEPECCICLQALFHAPSSSSQEQHPKLCDSEDEEDHEGDVGVLPCGHVLHFSCAHHHLTIRSTCPICRRQVSSHELIALKIESHSRCSDLSQKATEYMATLSTSCDEYKQKGAILQSRAEQLSSKKIDLEREIVAIESELDNAKRVEEALQGRYQKDLTARAEAERIQQLLQCVKDTRMHLQRTRENHASLIRENNDLTERIQRLRERIHCTQGGNGKRPRNETNVEEGHPF